jgi:hypothetical protein
LYFRIDSNETGIIDLYASDMHVVGIEHRTKRGFFEGLHFRLQAPGIDWRKMLGTEDIGASFGIIIQNYLDLQIGMFYLINSYYCNTFLCLSQLKQDLDKLILLCHLHIATFLCLSQIKPGFPKLDVVVLLVLHGLRRQVVEY